MSASRLLAVLLSIFGALGGGCLGLVLKQLYPIFGWWPLLLAFIGGPIAGFVYRQRAARVEALELRLISSSETQDSLLRLRAHRDELISA